VSLANHLDFFPAAAIGASKIQDGEGALLTLHFAGLPEAVETDIVGKHKVFRRRDPWRKFFAHHRLVEGDSVTIERLSPYEYRVAPPGNRVLVPQRVDPGRGARDLSDAQVTDRQGVLYPGSAEFRNSLAAAPPDRREMLQRAADWADTLEREGLVKLSSYRGKGASSASCPGWPATTSASSPSTSTSNRPICSSGAASSNAVPHSRSQRSRP
jgi:hypothetical protein